jgi:hypothetical protein
MDTILYVLFWIVTDKTYDINRMGQIEIYISITFVRNDSLCLATNKSILVINISRASMISP